MVGFAGIIIFELIVFVGTIIALFIFLKLSHKFHWFDVPDASRKLHKQVIPTAAGLVFMLPSIVFFVWSPHSEPFNSKIIGSIMLVLLLLGGWDDFKPMTAKFRLLVIMFCSAYFVYRVFASYDIGYLLLGIYIVGLIWWLNLYNFMDGADGMASLHAITTAFGYTLTHLFLPNGIYIMPFYILMFIFGVTAFLLFNFPKAKMFMGDAGSLSVAFALSAFALYGVANNIFGEILVISFHLVFIIDASLTLLTRLYFRHKITQAHSLHLYQLLIHRGFSHARVSLLYAMVTVLLVAITLYLHYINANIMLNISILAVEITLLSILWFYLQNKTKFKQFAK